MLSDVLLSPNHLSTVFHLRTSRGTGTCFFYQSSGGHFFVTAAHVIAKVLPGETIYFGQGDDWIGFPVLAIAFHSRGLDVAVFSLDYEFEAATAIDLPDPYFLPGQIVKFAGFPHGLTGQFKTFQGFSCPLIRGAFISGSILANGEEMLLLDGFNNPGYSGSPVWVSGDDGSAALIGMVIGFRYEKQELGKVFRKEHDGTVTACDHLYVNQNSGMIYAIHLASIGETVRGLSKFQPIKVRSGKANPDYSQNNGIWRTEKFRL